MLEGAKEVWKKSLFSVVLFILGWLGNSFLFAQNAEEHYKNGYIYFSQGQYERALEAYQSAIDINPQFTEAYYWLGKTYERLERIPEAVEAWKTALVIQPTHREAFQKWRAYATKKVNKGEKARLEKIFRAGDSSINIGVKEAWSQIIPYAFGLMETNTLDSLYLAGNILRWAGKNVSVLLYSYERLSYKKALQLLKSRFSEEDRKLVYDFLNDCLSRFGDDQEMNNLVTEVLETIFVAEAQISQDMGPSTQVVEFRIYEDRVERETRASLEDSLSEPDMEFYLRDHGAEGGS